jgi:hypothetical protein
MSIWDEFKGVSGEAWKPENPGDHIKGKVVGITVVASTLNDGKKHPAISVQTDDGEDRVIYASQAQLQRLLAEQEPSIGDRVAVVYTGTEKTSNGFNMKTFDVSVKKGDAASDSGGGAAAGVSAADLA